MCVCVWDRAVRVRAYVMRMRSRASASKSSRHSRASKHAARDFEFSSFWSCIEYAWATNKPTKKSTGVCVRPFKIFFLLFFRFNFGISTWEKKNIFNHSALSFKKHPFSRLKCLAARAYSKRTTTKNEIFSTPDNQQFCVQLQFNCFEYFFHVQIHRDWTLHYLICTIKFEQTNERTILYIRRNVLYIHIDIAI